MYAQVFRSKSCTYFSTLERSDVKESVSLKGDVEYFPWNHAGSGTKDLASVLTKEVLFPRTSWFTSVFKVAMAPVSTWLCTPCHSRSHRDVAANCFPATGCLKMTLDGLTKSFSIGFIAFGMSKIGQKWNGWDLGVLFMDAVSTE